MSAQIELPDDATAGEEVRRRREEVGLSKRELAERVGVGYGSVDNAERGRGGLAAEKVYRYLGIGVTRKPQG